MSENRASITLQTLSQFLAAGAGLVYLFGFVVVSVFDASYGIADFSLFRAKVVAVGMLFVLLLGFPVVITFRMFSLFGFSPRHPNETAPVSPKNRWLLFLDVMLYIPFTCFGISFPLGFLFVKGLHLQDRGFVLFVAVTVVLALVGIFSRRRFDRHPLVFVALSLLATIAFLAILLKYADKVLLWFVLWLVSVSVLTLYVSYEMRDRERARKTEWERLFVVIVFATFGMYATKVYPNLRHEFGGGAPVPVVLHLTKKLPVLDSLDVPASLIDETDHGYYILGVAGKAVFVTRSLVEELEFAGAASPSPTNPVPSAKP